MALIKCPECGKENVSDSAEMCPECGYGIKAHFDLVKQRQLNQEIRQRKLESVRMPERPKRMNFALTNFEKYQQETVREQEYKARIESMKPKCPACGSTDIQKITTMDRAVSISVVGAASGKIGKQYKCRRCKHMW